MVNYRRFRGVTELTSIDLIYRFYSATWQETIEQRVERRKVEGGIVCNERKGMAVRPLSIHSVAKSTSHYSSSVFFISLFWRAEIVSQLPRAFWSVYSKTIFGAPSRQEFVEVTIYPCELPSWLHLTEFKRTWYAFPSSNRN